jgi:phage/plasmid-like protein (TIGR03299 family)
MPDYFNVGSFRDVKSWHGKEVSSGGLFTGKVNIWEQMQKSQMDYHVHKVPATYVLSDGSTLFDNGRYGILREPTKWSNNWERLRVVGNRYEVIQNEDLARVLEPLNKEWPVEGMGVLKDGKIIFVELKLEPFDVRGLETERHDTFLLVANDHAQGSAKWGLTTVRVVCWNTYSMAEGDKRVINIPHTGEVESELAFRSALMQKTVERRKSTQETLDQLFVTKVTKRQTANVIEAAFPDPKPTRALRLSDMARGEDGDGDIFDYIIQRGESARETQEKQMERIVGLRVETGDALNKFNDEYPYAARTAYAVWNAVTAVTNHSPSFTGSAEKNLVSNFFGQKAQMMDRAWDECVKLCK